MFEFEQMALANILYTRFEFVKQKKITIQSMDIMNTETNYYA